MLVLAAGCNPLAIVPFLFGPEPTRPALYQPLVPKNADDKTKEKTIKVAILAYNNIESRAEFMQADRELALLTGHHLQEACTHNKEKVKVIDARKVAEFKNSHPDWKELDAAEIGKALKANAVIVLEIGSITLHDGCDQTMFRGKAQVTVSLVRVDDEEGMTLPPRDFTCMYPGESQGGYISADLDKTPESFKAEFFDVVGRKIAWHFTAHPTKDDYCK